MAVQDILDKRHYRRTFYSLVLLLGVTLALIRYFVIPIWDRGCPARC